MLLKARPVPIVPKAANPAHAAAPAVAAVVLNWNKASETAACVASLRCQGHPNLRIIVVDNASSDGSLGPLLRAPDTFDLVRNNANRGFAGGVNVGIARALEGDAAYIWLVNNDAQAEPGTLSTLLQAMQDDASIGLASPMIRNGDAGDAVEFCGGLWTGRTSRTTDDPAVYECWSRATPSAIWVVGTAMLIRREVIETIGLFDENLFAYWEDNDYALRSAAAGFRSVVVPHCVVRHWSGAPTKDAASKPAHYYYYMARNELLFLRKHLPSAARLRPVWWALARQARLQAVLQATSRGTPDAAALAEAARLGVLHGLLGRGGAYEPGRRLSGLERFLLTRTGRMYRHFV